MTKKKMTGTAAEVLETDLSQIKPFDETVFGKTEKRIFMSLNEANKKQIREGVCRSGHRPWKRRLDRIVQHGGICPQQSTIEEFAKRILPKIKKYYREHPDLVASLAEIKPGDMK